MSLLLTEFVNSIASYKMKLLFKFEKKHEYGWKYSNYLPKSDFLRFTW